MSQSRGRGSALMFNAESIRITLKPVRIRISAQLWKLYIILSFRNWFLARTLINPYFDREFGIKSFVEGAKAGFLIDFRVTSLKIWHQLDTVL